MSGFFHRLAGRRLRALVAALSLLAYGMNLLGFPLPASDPPPEPIAKAAAGKRSCGCRCGPKCSMDPCCCKPAAKAQPEPEARPAAALELEWVLGVRARPCTQFGDDWSQTPALTPPCPTCWAFDWADAGVLRGLSATLLTLSLDRSVPPPRLG